MIVIAESESVIVIAESESMLKRYATSKAAPFSHCLVARFVHISLFESF
jgi:hypothetical protein